MTTLGIRRLPDWPAPCAPGQRGRAAALRRLLATAGIALAGSTPLAAAPAEHRVPDTLQQRLLACTGCHGKDGRATSHGYFPRIAG